MKLIDTSAGRFAVGNREEIFRQAVSLSAHAWDGRGSGSFFLALSGGSTPVEWYRWCVSAGAFNHGLIDATEWFSSDERHVPLASDDSNFGTADRRLLTPLGVVPARKHPWPVELPHMDCAPVFEERFRRLRESDKAFDVCFLGLGTDGHTASIFPGSPLLERDEPRFFVSIEVPEKGKRHTITPRGLNTCGGIIVMAPGAGKKEALSRVLAADGSESETPARLLRRMRDKVTWLVDREACEGITELNP